MKLVKVAYWFALIFLAAPLQTYSQHVDDIYWTDDFAETNGMNGSVWDMVEYDNQLIVAGKFSSAGDKDARFIAAWDGFKWSALGTNNLQGGGIFALHVFEGKLYAGGYFSVGPPDPTFGGYNLAVWDGSQWDWVSGRADDTVFAITDIGGDLVVGGAFTSLGGGGAAKVARWDGALWHRYSNNIDGTVRTIEEYVGNTYVGGDFRSFVGGNYAGSIARWSGTEWVALSPYLSTTGPDYPRVWDFMVWNGRLWVTGYFHDGIAGGVNMKNIGSFNGTDWQAIGEGVNYARALYNYNGSLVVGATDGIFRWSGGAWEQLAASGSGEITSFAYHNYQHYVGGGFRVLEGDTVNYVATWGPAFAQGLKTGFNNHVYDIKKWSDDIAVCGAFSRSGDGRASRFALWNGSDWRPVSQLSHQGYLSNYPKSMVVHNDSLYAIGAFGHDSHSTFVYHFMKFDGTNWGYYGPPGGPYPAYLDYPALTGLSYDGELVVGGRQPIPLMFLYTVGPTVDYFGGSPPMGAVHTLCENNGAMLAGGAFTSMAGEPMRSVGSWSGSEWSAFGAGINGTVYAVQPYGDWIIAGGEFDSAGTVAASNIAAWDGVDWLAMGEGVDAKVTALALHDNAIIVAGDFLTAGGIPTNYIAQWYSSSWSPLGSGVDGPVYALLADDSSVYVGGNFLKAGESSSPYFARWDKFEGQPMDVENDLGTGSLPLRFNLSQNYPNPFNPATTIEYSLPRRSYVRIEVYNIIGQRVRTLVDRDESAGSYTVEWDGKDRWGKSVATGVYLYRCEAGDQVQYKKMLLLK